MQKRPSPREADLAMLLIRGRHAKQLPVQGLSQVAKVASQRNRAGDNHYELNC
eukprot:CAMPEP_0204199856 /NCGR_PEP_ID=MMETSP0361-20130328/66309_1 /ASSEMBLY_ACC=CAM_ASM_000343 /TAXON_ID=268821 /ORGANISM="Scrippsiella Hangoei, Strain SHTV-5" /LENGTH=52 /DNA_ID=CAMNT_0051162207 /DNA_START=57 /DNA_END=212 /DNA_ORIENTATION=-